MSFKVPSFMSTYFSTLTQEQKGEAIARYKSWYTHDFTELLIDHLADTHGKLVQEDEDKSDFLSKFQFSYVSIRNKAQRKLIKGILKKMEWEI